LARAPGLARQAAINERGEEWRLPQRLLGDWFGVLFVEYDE
jgi:hypothetical protein